MAKTTAEIVFYEGPLKKNLEKHFTVFFERILIGEHKLVPGRSYLKWKAKYDEYKCRPTDIWVVSYPKAGTTWTQEMVWCILFGLKCEEANQLLMKRFPFFEWDSAMPDETTVLEKDDPCSGGESWRIVNNMKDPRTIKSHFHVELLPKSLWTSHAKVIYVCRDPKDVCVSYFYHSRKINGFTGKFTDFFEIFINDLAFCSPIWRHILNFWKKRDDPNVLFIRYEEFSEDLPGMIKKCANFLGKKITDEFERHLTRHLHFDNMKNNKAVNNEAIWGIKGESSDHIKFMRKGKVGDWKTHFTEELTERFRNWTEENLKNSDFPVYRDFRL